MRAYTSLVGHILGSHPEIDGYYEMHRAYMFADDLARQAAQFAAHDAVKPGSRWLFDKLLHNDYTLNLDLPGLADAAIFIALRPPEPTLRSIVALFAQKYREDPYATPAGATAYYIARLGALAAFAADHPRRFYYFDADMARDDTPRLLAALGRWLQLATPLAETYRTFSQTGRAGAGDSSARLSTGHVVRTAHPSPALALDPALQQQATAAYQHCRARIIAHAIESITLETACPTQRVPHGNA